ncbi:DnaT-like ssDNA-binding protein [Pasteurella multocida]|uniref:DnaT-like ssDNA-binding protein n=1 Tax=Pasteurella multocida TaxID=747 RepID=UPI0035F3A911
MDLIIPNDSYVTLEEANKYHANRNSAFVWQELDDETKARRLVSASDFLDFNYRFLGRKADPSQLRAFPRTNTGGTDSKDIPTSVKYAVFELALYENLNENPDSEMSSVRVGPLSVNFEKNPVSGNASNRFEYVKSILDTYLDKSQGGGKARMLRG